MSLGYRILATRGTAEVLRSGNLPVDLICKLSEGRPSVLDYIKNRDIALLINTPSGPKPRKDEIQIRTTAAAAGVPYITTMAGAFAAAAGLAESRRQPLEVKCLQDYF